MQICPCCKQVIRTPKAAAAEKVDSRITKDLKKVAHAIECLERAEKNPWFADILESIADEKIRMRRALADRRLMWNIFRRADKGAPYYTAASARVRKAA